MKPFQSLLVAAPAAALLVQPIAASANELNLDTVQGYSIAQATTIRDFSDVYPTDWAYQALSELVETYGCIAGFGDGTFRGNQPVTRFQMAAILNSCLDSISAKVDMMGEEMKMSATEDMKTLERLVASFEEELITLKGSVDGLDAKVSELSEHQFSTTTKAKFKISTDFTYFGSGDNDRWARMKDAIDLVAAQLVFRLNDEDAEALIKGLTGEGEDNSGLSLSSKAEVKFTTSFTGSDKLTFKIKGDVIGSRNDDPDFAEGELPGDYLVMGNFYDVAGSDTSVEFSGFTYETPLDLGGMAANLTFGTDFADLDGIVGLDTYYGDSEESHGGGWAGYGSGEFGNAPSASVLTQNPWPKQASLISPDGSGFGGFGEAGVGFNLALLSSEAGTLTASASYAVAGDHASDQMGKKGIFGEDTNYSGALALNWDGALFGGNEAMFTVAYRSVDYNNLETDEGTMTMLNLLRLPNGNIDMKQSDWRFVAGAYITDTLSVSGSYAFGTLDYNIRGLDDAKFAQWMLAANLEDAIFPGNSAGIAYGTTAYLTNNKPEGYKVPTVLELYYSFNVNDNFEIPVYLDFIGNSFGRSDSDAFAIAVRPTLTF